MMNGNDPRLFGGHRNDASPSTTKREPLNVDGASVDAVTDTLAVVEPYKQGRKEGKRSPLFSKKDTKKTERKDSPSTARKETKKIEKKLSAEPGFTGADSKSKRKGSSKRRLVICRHGERVDFTFGRDWVKENFDASGRYNRKNLNLPRTLPNRPGGPGEFLLDSPLTNIGHYQAQLTGEALREAGLTFSCVYASPSLRCVQTATALLESMKLKLPIRLEPGLFEWLGYYPTGLPRFFNPSEFDAAGFNIDMHSPPCVTLARLQECMKETIEQYYNRSSEVTKFILQKEPPAADTLVVGHAGSLDACTRQVLGKTPRRQDRFNALVQRVPYVCPLMIEGNGERWGLAPLPCPIITQSGCGRDFDWKMFM